ncbi:MAG: hypothetical protein A3I66_08085 [Burkholderiales bacterium RIFCSPLOWO2_02_FULL_57_36]|nr:MAG: hypothetical protein A3I66_08085 [Burkholderiales bacterium RIFCSPLOWO2_02_FULL_57_36]
MKPWPKNDLPIKEGRFASALNASEVICKAGYFHRRRDPIRVESCGLEWQAKGATTKTVQGKNGTAVRGL